VADARNGRERTRAKSNRADHLHPNIGFSKRDSYQRRGHFSVSKVGSYRLTLPRRNLTEQLIVIPLRIPLPQVEGRIQ
jgi:hypothetical protein